MFAPRSGVHDCDVHLAQPFLSGRAFFSPRSKPQRDLQNDRCYKSSPEVAMKASLMRIGRVVGRALAMSGRRERMNGSCVATIDLVRQANRALIEGKKFAPHIEEAASKLPRLTPEEINAAWKKANGKATRNVKV